MDGYEPFAREINERIEKLAEAKTTEFVCECGNTEGIGS
jgi:hypothetical protein